MDNEKNRVKAWKGDEAELMIKEEEKINKDKKNKDNYKVWNKVTVFCIYLRRVMFLAIIV